MALSLEFADSFAHYDNTALKWTTAGGVFETVGAHVRTGPQSLRIQAGDSPTLDNLSSGSSFFTVGVGWQTSILAGETIFSLIDSVSGDRQLFLVQLANGSVEARTGAGVGTLLGTTAAGVLTVGPFWYLELTVNLNTNSSPTVCILTVTNVAGVATQALNLSGFATSQITADRLTWGGPSGGDHAWIADFYVTEWDQAGSSVYGAPKIYGVIPPIADGPIGVWPPNLVTVPFDVSAAPYFPQVAAIPQNTASFISRDDSANPFAWPDPNQSFKFNVSNVPPGSTIAAVQVTIMWQFEAASKSVDLAGFGAYAGLTGSAVSTFHFVQSGLGANGFAMPLDAPAVEAFFFYVSGFDTNPATALPWILADFSGPTAALLGPATASLS